MFKFIVFWKTRFKKNAPEVCLFLSIIVALALDNLFFIISMLMFQVIDMLIFWWLHYRRRKDNDKIY